VQIVRELVARATPAELFVHIADLDAYPAWMPLIHAVERIDTEGPAWSVELRAKVGPLARSKRLRMVRTEVEQNELAVFERSENDGRRHSAWVLRAALVPESNAPAPTRLTMTLTYGGSLWAGPVLERVLDDQVRRGSQNLLQLVS
jgi:carbon monoxide dehydrogenase subunit G